MPCVHVPGVPGGSPQRRAWLPGLVAPGQLCTNSFSVELLGVPFWFGGFLRVGLGMCVLGWFFCCSRRGEAASWNLLEFPRTLG